MSHRGEHDRAEQRTPLDPVGEKYRRRRDGFKSGGSAGLGLFPVKVTKDGGAAGDATSQCTFTYTVYAMDGTTILKTTGGANATAVTPEKWRMNLGTYHEPTALTFGTAFYDGATLHLYDVAQEVPVASAC